MPTLSVHSFGNEHFEAFYRPEPSSAGGFRSYGTLERVAFEISVLMGTRGVRSEEIEFENRYGESTDLRDFEKVVSAVRKISEHQIEK